MTQTLWGNLHYRSMVEYNLLFLESHAKNWDGTNCTEWTCILNQKKYTYPSGIRDEKVMWTVIKREFELIALGELNQRYEGLVIELDNTLHTHQRLTTLQRQLSDELRVSFIPLVSILKQNTVRYIRLLEWTTRPSQMDQRVEDGSWLGYGRLGDLCVVLWENYVQPSSLLRYTIG